MDFLKRIVAVLLLWAFCLTCTQLTTGCSTTQFQAALSKAESAAWTAANAIMVVNAQNGNILTHSLVNYAMKVTENDENVDVVTAAADLANKVIAAQVAAKAAGADNAGMQEAATNLLSNSGVIQKVAAALKEAKLLRGKMKLYAKVDLRPIHGWKNPYDLSVAR